MAGTVAPTRPLVVIGGYLGAGKTTLVNHLLRHAAGRRLAVLVNDFGDISIDADLIVGAADGVLALAGGCVCCSFGSDLIGSLVAMAQRQPPPDLILLECSGVGLPAAVARSAALAPGVVVQGVVVLADASEIRRQQRDPYVGDTVSQQLQQADLLVLNQAERVQAGARDALQAWLAQQAPGVPQASCSFGRLPVELVLGLSPPTDADAADAGVAGWAAHAGRWQHQGAAADNVFRYTSQQLQGPVDVPALAAGLVAPGSGLLRAKGVVLGLDGQHWLVQVVGRRVTTEALAAPPSATVGHLACISLANALTHPLTKA